MPETNLEPEASELNNSDIVNFPVELITYVASCIMEQAQQGKVGILTRE